MKWCQKQGMIDVTLQGSSAYMKLVEGTQMIIGMQIYTHRWCV